MNLIPKIDRLPTRIKPCPIVEAAVEMRFVSNEPWRNMPGLLAPRLRGRYPQDSELPLAGMPEAVRLQDPNLAFQPLVQYESPKFLFRFGPRAATLITRPNQYPGWQLFRDELHWLWSQMADAQFVREGERLGMRYVDFFKEDIFLKLILNISVDDKAIRGVEQTYSVVVPDGDATARLVLANAALLRTGQEARKGSVLDLDVWRRLTSEDFFAEARTHIERLHDINKRLFFGLLKPDFLATLNPEY